MVNQEQPSKESQLPPIEEIRSRLRALGYLDSPVERYLSRPAGGPWRTGFLVTLKVSLLVGLLLSGIVGWPLAYGLRRPRATHPLGAGVARWIAAITGLLVVAGILIVRNELAGPTMELSYGVPDRLVWLLRLPFLTTLLTVAMILFTVQAWRSRWWSRAARVHYTAITLGALMLIPLELYWKLFGSGP